MVSSGLLEGRDEVSDSFNHEPGISAGDPHSFTVHNQENSRSHGDADHVEELGELGVALVDLCVHDVWVLSQDTLDESFQVVICCPQHFVNWIWLVEEQQVNVIVVALEVI